MRVQDVHLDTSWLHESPLHRPNSSKKQLQLSSSIVINVKARAGARLRRSVDPMQQFVCLPYQLMRSAAGVIVVLAQLQNHCRSRETCSFGTPDAVVCRAARSASAALAAVGESVGIAERAGAVVVVCCWPCGGGARARAGERRLAVLLDDHALPNVGYPTTLLPRRPLGVRLPSLSSVVASN